MVKSYTYQRGGDFGSDLYSGTATIGRACSWISAIVMTIIGGLMIALGIYILTLKDKDTATTQATVSGNSACHTEQGNNHTTYTVCDTPVTYSASGQIYTSSVRSSTNYNVGTTVTIYYDPQNPQNIELAQQPYKTIGSVLIGIGAFIIVLRWLTLILAMKSQAFASFEGVLCAFGTFGGLLRRY